MISRFRAQADVRILARILLRSLAAICRLRQIFAEAAAWCSSL
jgi:hypothetical protein